MSSSIDPADYVLGTLSPEQQEQARTLEREDPAFAAEVTQLRAVMGRVERLGAAEWEALPSPPPLRTDDMVPAGAPAPATRRRPSFLQRLGERLSTPSLTLRPGLAAAAAALLVAVGVGGGMLIAGDGSDGPPRNAPTVALAPIGSGPPSARALAALGEESGQAEVTIDARNLRPSRAGTHYEVWMIHDARRMVSLGSFQVGPGGRAVVKLPVTVSARDYPIMDISLERDDGAPGHSGDSVLRSPATPS